MPAMPWDEEDWDHLSWEEKLERVSCTLHNPHDIRNQESNS